MGGWVGPRADVGGAKKKNPLLLPEIGSALRPIAVPSYVFSINK
jgi:hypothetical protein